ncbi:hypothetical protein P4O66_016770 [Electrophorus voltai]|uniref:Uncharacterized protein n=1 Tax=Electrophorus voltai TaxID=2609070 RepID=A0AAD8YYN5_9TELE|nr:hypothetical protein P4O66_016770 [Electrophorus voltai]
MHEPEPSTPPHLLKAKRKYSCSRSRKKTTLNPEPFDDKNLSLHEKDPDRNVSKEAEYPAICGTEQSTWQVDVDTSVPSSSDSNYSLNALLPTMSSSGTAGSTVDQESPCLGSHCSVCDDRTGSEDGSPGKKDLDTPPSGSFLLKDHMLGVLSPLATKRMPTSPTLPQTPVLPFFPLLGAGESLHLSPSLLTSPARGLSHPLLPEGQEELQTLFEDVWVTPKPVVLKECSLSCHSPGDWSEEEDRGSDDVTWTPKKHIRMKKTNKVYHKRISRKSQAVTNPGMKKKCVNGFIMFCRMNRRLYLSLKARHFSRQQNRNVRSEVQDAEGEEEDCVPSPLHMLLAHRDMCFPPSGKP